ncbi:Six-hairpin glycosidase-like protein [Lasiosphaeris hirsuta]|uniref:Glucoamylase n=1 Tax=Lasiosphaeris hirsuta TaxID=260670 RepID=A0AA40AGZ7_9PEZI|nr:Six-hairpin glycosidase-like protein [Lasiosphaeris hirsuta]
MFYASSLLLLAGVWVGSTVAEWPQGVPLDEFIVEEREIALRGVLDNIGPNGARVPGAAPGIVIASPSKQNPDYFYTWTRDASLTFKTIVDEFIDGNADLQPYIDDFVHAQAILQTGSNPSGTLLPSGTGLGEPKYKADGTRFNGNWGRPQRDGPALRATALIGYANWLVEHGEKERVKTVIWPVIANDLSYVGEYWNSTGFDLWEEVMGSSFFTTQSQYRSLVEGGTLAETLGVLCEACSEAPQVLCFLQTYWNGEYFTANINDNSGRGGVDANTILGPIAAFDLHAACDSPSLQPCHSRVLANFKVFVDTFRNSSLYPINAGIPSTEGIAVGRYPEDSYFIGNPWYLITLGAAEFLYDAVAQWAAQGFITITPTSLPFFLGLYPNATTNSTYKRHKNSSPFHAIVNATTAYADSFVSIAQKYTPSTGSLAEQFLKTPPGTPLSATALTWSFASFVSMSARRAGRFPPSWLPSSSSLSLPSTCTASSVTGTYSPATAAGAPEVTVPCTTTVRLAVNATTYYGENVYVVGNITDLGIWDAENAQTMRSDRYTEAWPLWYAEVPLDVGPEGAVVAYKYVRQQDCGQDWVWEEGNRTVVVPGCGGEGVVEEEGAWVGRGGSAGGVSCVKDKR